MSILRGYRIDASYRELMSICQTEEDGSSVDLLEEALIAKGIDAHQTVVPPDYLFMPEAGVVPALILVRPGHFIVAWRRHGPFVQFMDPGRGRAILPPGLLTRRLYPIVIKFTVSLFLRWARGQNYLTPLQCRLANIGGSDLAAVATRIWSTGNWFALSALDAAARYTGQLMAQRVIPSDIKPAALLMRLHERAVAQGPGSWTGDIPEPCWCAIPDQHELSLRATVVVRLGNCSRLDANPR